MPYVEDLLPELRQQFDDLQPQIDAPVVAADRNSHRADSLFDGGLPPAREDPVPARDTGPAGSPPTKENISGRPALDNEDAAE